MNLSTRTALGAVAAGSAAVAVALAVGAGPVLSRPEPPPFDSHAAIEAVRAGKGRLISTSVHYSGWWQGCRFVIYQSPVKSYESPAGAVSIEEKPEPAAGTPSPPACAERQPTQDEITAMKAEVDARNALNRPVGAPPLPAIPLGGPNGTPGARDGTPPLGTP